MRNKIILLACAILQNSCWYGERLSYHHVIGGKAMRYKQQTNSEINKEASVRIAKEHAIRIYKSLETYNTIPCEQGAFWRVFFEPKNIRINKKAVEYVIRKQDGKVVRQHEFHLTIQDSVNKGKPLSETISIQKERAVVIARRDAVKLYGALTPYDLTVCELTEMWSIIFSPKGNLDGGGPEYLIDKKTGQILYKKYYQ